MDMQLEKGTRAGSSTYSEDISINERSSPAPFSSDKKDEKKQPFPFFDLPLEILYKILREYVPVTDKAGALKEVADFRPYLDLDSVWFPSTRHLFQLASILPPGWYVNAQLFHERYYVSVDYVHLTFSLDTFSTQCATGPACVSLKEEQTPASEMRGMLIHLWQSHHLLPIGKDDVLYYSYLTAEPSIHVCFWIFIPEKLVYWSGDFKKHPLIDGQCTLESDFETLLLTLQEDRKLKITCIIHRSSQHGYCSCPKYDPLLSPFAFKECIDYAITKHISIIDSIPFSCMNCGVSPQVLHPLSTTIFKNIHRADASVVKKEYYRRQKVYFKKPVRRRLIF